MQISLKLIKYTSSGSDDGLVPKKQQAIIVTNDNDGVIWIYPSLGLSGLRTALMATWPTENLHWYSQLTWPCCPQGWGQLHNINSTPTPTPEVSTPTPTPANLQNINSNSNSNSNSGGFNSNSNSNSGKSPEYQLQLQLQLRRFQLQLQFQLRQISRISTPTPIPTPTPEFQIQPQLHFKSNQFCSTKQPLANYNVKHSMN